MPYPHSSLSRSLFTHGDAIVTQVARLPESSHQGKQEGAVVSEEVLEQINKEVEMDSPRKDHDSVRFCVL